MRLIAVSLVALVPGLAAASGSGIRFEALPPSAADRSFEVSRSDEARRFASRAQARSAVCEGVPEASCHERPLLDEAGERYYAIASRRGDAGATVEALDLLVEDRASGSVTAAYHVEVNAAIGAPGPAEAHASPAGRLMRIPVRFSGTGAFNGDLYFLRAGDTWREIDAASWVASLRLPPGHGLWKGVVINPRDLSARSQVWREGDGNCCPSGGEVRVRLRIEGRAFVVDEQEFRPGPSSPR